jgi:acyl carrier protein
MWDTQFEQLLRQALPFLSADEPLDEGTSLREYGLDSLSTVELLSALEAAYRIRFSDEALALETFRTPATVWEALSAMDVTKS